MIKDPIVLLLTRLNTLIANKYEKTQNRDETKAFGARGKLQLTQFLRNLMALPAVRSISSARRRANPRSTFLCLFGGARELLHNSNIRLDKCFPKSAPYCIIGREYENRVCEAIIFSCLAAFLSTLLIPWCTCKDETL